MTVVSSLLISVAANLVTPIFEHYTRSISSPIKKRVVKSRLEAVSMSAFANIEAYFEHEVRAKDRGERIERIIVEASAIVMEAFKDPTEVLSSSLDAKSFVTRYIEENGFPQAVIEDETTTPFLHFFSSCVRMLLELPEIMKEWETQAWTANFRKLDVLAQLLEDQTSRVIEISDKVTAEYGQSEKGMISLKAALLQADARSEVEMQGLSRAQASPLQLKSIFVSPELNATINKSVLHTLTEDIHISEFFSRRGRMHRIFGEAGSGKTTLVRWLEQSHWSKGNRFAIRCELRLISKQNSLPNILDLVDQSIPRDLRGTLSKTDFKKWLDEGKMLVIFDGFDEVSQPNRTKVANWIKASYIGINEDNSFIITSRPLTTSQLNDGNWKGCSNVKVKGFDKPRVINYISKWQSNMLTPQEKEQIYEDELPEALADTFTSAETIKELTANPLLLSTLMMVHRFEGKKLPQGRADLYRVYVDGMLGQWYNKVESSDYIKLDAGLMRKVLRVLAVRMQVAELAAVDEDTAFEWIKLENKTQHSEKRVLEHMLERTGLLIGPGEYQFAHKSIGEFLVAEAIVTEQVRIDGVLIDRLYLLKYAQVDFWRVVLFLWAGLVPSKLDLIEFCHFLIGKGQVGVALGLAEEFFEDLLSDHPEKTAELVTSAILVPAKDCIDLKMSGMSSTAFLDGLYPRVPGSLVMERHRYLTITGEDSFGQGDFAAHELAALIPVTNLEGRRGDSSFYHDMWSRWVRHGGNLDILLSQRPSRMTECQAFLLACAIRGLLTEPSVEHASFNPIFYVPVIVNDILSPYHNPNSSMLHSEDDSERLARLEAFLKRHPMASWADYWFKTLMTKPQAQELAERFAKKGKGWDESVGLPTRGSLQGDFPAGLNEIGKIFLSERRSRTQRFSNDGHHFVCENGLLYPVFSSSEPNTLQDIFGDEVFSEARELLKRDLAAGSMR